MNKQTEEALKMAIEAIEYQESLDPFESSTTEWNHSWKELHKALIICKEALAEAEKQEWQSLSDDEITKAICLRGTDDSDWNAVAIDYTIDYLKEDIVAIARAIEQALKEKNHA